MELVVSLFPWICGVALVALGAWILLLQIEGALDWHRPRSISIDKLTINGEESSAHAELLRARYNHHFLRINTFPKETGFLEVATFDTPELFQSKPSEGVPHQLSIEVSGVDAAKLVQLVNELFQPARWVVEGHYQVNSDRAHLALHLRRGRRSVRTWYLERPCKPGSADQSEVIEHLIDDAIFQLVFDLGNQDEQDRYLKRWHREIPFAMRFSGAAALGAYYEGRGALARYYAQGDWAELDRAIERLRALRGYMPEFANGLQLLGLALAERREEEEAIHVFEQLRLLLLPEGDGWAALSGPDRRRLLYVDLLRATATAKLFTWQSAHAAVAQLLKLEEQLAQEAVQSHGGEDADMATAELRSLTAIQLAYTYALYLGYLRSFTVFEVFGSKDAPAGLRLTDPEDIRLLREGPPAKAKPIVVTLAQSIKAAHEQWLATATERYRDLHDTLSQLRDGRRRQSELKSRLQFASGDGHYRMAEWEHAGHAADTTIFGKTFAERMEMAGRALRDADAAHPNHYLVLQHLGIIYSEPRYEGEYLSIAEQYLERAVIANPADYYGHTMLAEVIQQRVLRRGLDATSRSSIERGLAETKVALARHETSGSTQLIDAELQLMLFEVERDPGLRRGLSRAIDQRLSQAARFLPVAFGKPNPDLLWVRALLAMRLLGDAAEILLAEGTDASAQQAAERFELDKRKLLSDLGDLLAICELLKDRWVAEQRLFHISGIHERVLRLRTAVAAADLANWRELPLPL